jgi:sugar phosphate isomerase/epimerase
MQLGIFAKTFPGTDPTAVLATVKAAGYGAAQFNLACAGLAAMPESVPPEAIARIRAATAATGVTLASLSGTYNMAHPDPGVRADGRRRLAVAIEAAADLAIPLVSLCTGTRDPDDQWRYHPQNGDPAAWSDMAAEIAAALDAAEAHDIELGIEPEPGNVVTSATDALRLIADLRSPRLKVVLDPANLFEHATPEEARVIVARAVAATAGQVAMAHAKDRDAQGGVATPGQGIVDFADFITRLHAEGFNGPLIAHGFSAEAAPAVA